MVFSSSSLLALDDLAVKWCMHLLIFVIVRALFYFIITVGGVVHWRCRAGGPGKGGNQSGKDKGEIRGSRPAGNLKAVNCSCRQPGPETYDLVLTSFLRTGGL